MVTKQHGAAPPSLPETVEQARTQAISHLCDCETTAQYGHSSAVCLSVGVRAIDDLIAAVKAESAPVQTGWQPISTAPKNGTRLLGWALGWKEPATVKYVEEWAKPWAKVPGMFPCDPTHWMPLPPLSLDGPTET